MIDSIGTEPKTLEKLRREAEPFMRYIGDGDTTDILINPDGNMWVKSLQHGKRVVGTLRPTQAESLARTIATYYRTTITDKDPILERAFPLGNARIEVILTPLADGPVIAIRCKASQLYTLSDYVRDGIMTEKQKEVIQAAVESRKNILIVGGTGSGKTTLTNALADDIVRVHPHHRLVILEDTAEIQCRAQDCVFLRTSDDVDMMRLLKATMRLQPDRILVGEVRGGEALTLLKAWNTGHPGGIATVHANSAYSGLIRMEQLIAEVSRTPMPGLIAEAVNQVIFITDSPQGRRVREIIAVDGHDGSGYLTHRMDS